LELVSLARNSEFDWNNHVSSEFESAGNFAFLDIASSFGDEGNTLLRSIGLELAQSVIERCFIDHFIVTNVTVTLASQEQNTRVFVIERHEHTSRVINVGSLKGFAEGAGIPDGELAFTGLSETNREQSLLVSEPDDAGTLGTSVSFSFNNRAAGAGIYKAKLLVLAGSGTKRAIIVP